MDWFLYNNDLRHERVNFICYYFGVFYNLFLHVLRDYRFFNCRLELFRKKSRPQQPRPFCWK